MSLEEITRKNFIVEKEKAARPEAPRRDSGEYISKKSKMLLSAHLGGKYALCRDLEKKNHLFA